VEANRSKLRIHEARIGERKVRVEKIPVPTILLKFKKAMVTGPTEYPSGDLLSTGAPLAS
jgi:hypothetical protein